MSEGRVHILSHDIGIDGHTRFALCPLLFGWPRPDGRFNAFGSRRTFAAVDIDNATEATCYHCKRIHIGRVRSKPQ